MPLFLVGRTYTFKVLMRNAIERGNELKEEFYDDEFCYVLAQTPFRARQARLAGDIAIRNLLHKKVDKDTTILIALSDGDLRVERLSYAIAKSRSCRGEYCKTFWHPKDYINPSQLEKSQNPAELLNKMRERETPQEEKKTASKTRKEPVWKASQATSQY